MEVGIGLPAGVPGAAPDLVVDWARSAEAAGFASLGTVDRTRYDSYEPLVALSAAAAVTDRVQLVTCILVAPLRETASLAKQVASLDALSGGRVVFGVAVGARKDDYDLSETPYAGRGDRLTDQLTELRAHWEEGEMGPFTARKGGPPILVGGASGAAMARVARQADGYVHGGGPPRAFARAADQARAAWADAGRPGRPQLWGQGYFALGDDADAGREYMLDYYAFTGPFAQRIADGLLTTPLEVREFCEGYEQAGCDHLVLMPAVAGIDQVDKLAAALSSG
jgi:alkanesulfonate monooxygenase SsuD/methylene tetrahydromethanopterin reductase-like flavin-dependent oxidoreductase (luciferase family)